MAHETGLGIDSIYVTALAALGKPQRIEIYESCPYWSQRSKFLWYAYSHVPNEMRDMHLLIMQK